MTSVGRVVAVGLALAWMGSARAAGPLPITNCGVGGVGFGGRPSVEAIRQSLRRVFPTAAVSTLPMKHGVEALELTENGKALLKVLYSRAFRAGGDRITVELFSPRFELAGAVHPGDKVVAAERVLGRASIDLNLTTDELELTFAEQSRSYDWPNCALNFRPTTSRRSSARIAAITLDAS